MLLGLGIHVVGVGVVCVCVLWIVEGFVNDGTLGV